MRIGIIIATATLLLSSVSGASAHHYRHHHQSQNPMVRGLGAGFIHMLRASRENHRYNEYVGPTYAPSYETKAKAGELPNVLDIPPRGWPFRRATERRTERHYARYTRGSRLAGLDGSCRSAARQGGPCGCWAQEHFFGSAARLYHGVNLWLARSWLQFPHTMAAAGTAAVWPGGHHVAPVVGVNGDGTVTVRDSWGTHAVRMARLTFVSPR